MSDLRIGFLLLFLGVGGCAISPSPCDPILAAMDDYEQCFNNWGCKTTVSDAKAYRLLERRLDVCFAEEEMKRIEARKP